jgi:predicted TPR repeat methyltransferase
MTEADVERDIAAAAAHRAAGDVAKAQEICHRVLSHDSNQPDALHILGLIELARGRADEAVHLIQRAISDTEWPMAQFDLARALSAQGKRDEAIAALLEAVRQEPRFIEAHWALGGLSGETKDYARAADAYQKVTELKPDLVGAYNNLGLALAGLGRSAEAEAAYRRAIALKPDYQPAYHNLSNLLLAQLRPQEALAMAQRSVELAPDEPEEWQSLGNALRGADRLGDAAAAYERAAQLRPGFVEARLSLAPIWSTFGRHDEAIAQLRIAATTAPARADVHRALGLALAMAKRPAAAQDAFAESLRLNPSQPQVQYELAVLAGQTPPSAPAEYVAALFDDYALRFEKHLVQSLQYRGPEQIRAALDAIGATGPMDVMDIGCGTGLMGRQLRGRARSLVGVDLSPKMVELARRSGIYDRVEQADAVAALRVHRQAFDLIVAADVLIYLGELAGPLAAAGEALRSGGCLAFSLELHDGDGFVLKPTRRYCHSLSYLRAVAGANALEEVYGEEVVLRLNEGIPVRAWIAVFRKTGAGA